MNLLEEIGMTLCQNALGHKKCPCAESGKYNCANEHPGQQARSLLPIIEKAVQAGLDAAKDKWTDSFYLFEGRVDALSASEIVKEICGE